MNDRNTIIGAHRLCKSYGRGPARVAALTGLELDVRDGEFVAVMGPSGCGKSTLLHVLGLMTPPDKGDLLLDGQPVPQNESGRMLIRRDMIGFIFQGFNLIGSLTAKDNIAISLKIRGIKTDDRIGALLEQLGIAGVAHRKPAEMSIGEQQRTAIARAIAHDPKIILADEPTGNLDRGNTTRLLDCFRDIHAARGHTIVMITHDPNVASCAERVLHMDDGRLHGEPGDIS